jgi:hypothetical protein
MAVRTNDTEVDQAVVGRISVDVVQLERRAMAAPGVDATYLALRFLEALADQALPEPSTGEVGRVGDEDFGRRARRES